MLAMTQSESWRAEFYQDERGRQPVKEWLLTLEAKIAPVCVGQFDSWKPTARS